MPFAEQDLQKWCLTPFSIAAIGGSPGALIACRLFRHKTRKQPFATLLLLTLALQAGAAAGWLLG